MDPAFTLLLNGNRSSQAEGSENSERWIEDGNEFKDKKTGKTVRVKALVLKGARFANAKPDGPEAVLSKARRAAEKKYKERPWPKLIFTSEGQGGPRLKRYLKDIRKGKVPLTYWADEDYEVPLDLDSQSWDHEESGHSQMGINELDAVVGKGHEFKTVKPLRLFKKIIQIWCRSEGIVLTRLQDRGRPATRCWTSTAKREPIAVSFLLSGNTDKGDHYAKTLTAERLRRVVKGDWAAGPHKPRPVSGL